MRDTIEREREREGKRGDYKLIDKFILWYLPALYVVCFIISSCLQVYFFNVKDYDFNFFLTQPYRIFQGWDACIPFSLSASEYSFYAHHFTPLSFLLAPVIGLFPSPYTLAVIHACSVGLVAFILPRLAQCVLESSSLQDQPLVWRSVSLFILLIFFFFSPYIAAYNCATHFTTLVTPALALALLSLHKGWHRILFICCILILIAQERASVSIFGLGMYAVLVLRQYRLGIFLCLVSTTWFFGVVKVILPLLRDYAGLDGDYAFAHAINVGVLLPQKLSYLFLFCLFSIFLPFCGKKAFLTACCALPMIGMSLVSGREGMLRFVFHYQDLPSIFVLLSMTYGAAWLQQKISFRHWWKLATVTVIVYIVAIQLSNTALTNPIPKTISFLTSPHRDALSALNEDVKRFADVPEEVHLYVQSGMGPRFAFFRHRYAARAETLAKAASHPSFFIISPVCFMQQKDSFEQLAAKADRQAGLELVLDNGRMRVYASQQLKAEYADLLSRITE